MIRTLPDFWESHYRPLRLLGTRTATIEQHKIAMRHWSAFAGPAPLDLIDRAALARFAAHLLQFDRPATVNKTLRHLLAVLRLAEEESVIAACPRWQRLKEPRRVPLAFTVAEFSAVLSEAVHQPGTIAGLPAGTWWGSLLRAAWYSGARIGALLAVTRADVLVDVPGFYVRAEAQKQHADQFFQVDESTAASFRSLWEPARPLFWPWPFLRGCLLKRFRRIIEAAGVPAEKGTGLFHRIRRSTASYIKKAGGDATAQLGHSTPTVTARYFDPRIVGTLNAAALMPRPLLTA